MRAQRQSKGARGLRPGQIWLVEQAPNLAFAAYDRDALESANVVIYDRGLTALVQQFLPLGTYAEPLGHGHKTISPRALEFAAGGWSVVQLVEARCGMRAGLRGAAETLARLECFGELPVQVIARSAQQWAHDGNLPELHRLIEEIDEEDFLTLVLGPMAAQRAAPALAFTANGLAG